MKPIGALHKIDKLGRVVIPVELRRVLGMSVHDVMEFYIEDDCIVMKKYNPSCIFCGDADGVFYFNGKLTCRQCADTLKSY